MKKYIRTTLMIVILSMSMSISCSACFHRYKTIIKATCTHTGIDMCLECGKTKKINRKPHNFECVKYAKCESNGLNMCTSCGKRIVTKKIGHQYVFNRCISCGKKKRK